MRMIFFATMAVVVLSLVSPLEGADLYVSPAGSGTGCTSSNPCSFQQALTTAQGNSGENDTIFVGAGQYLLSSTLTYSTQDGDGTLTIEAQNPADPPVLDGQNNNIQVLRIDTDANTDGTGDAGSDITIINLTIQNGKPTVFGGGLYVHTGGAGLVLDNNTFSGNGRNNSTSGGAYVESTSGTITISNNTFSGNATGDKGGGAYVKSTSGTITISNNTFSGNIGYWGGGAYVKSNSGTHTISDNTFSDNQASLGGGLYMDGSGSADFTIRNNTFTANQAVTAEGGGLYIYNAIISTSTLTNNTFSKNTAATDGGGLYIFAIRDATLTNNTFYQNGAQNIGGGIYGLTFPDSATIDIYNNLMWDNQAQAGGDDGDDIYLESDGDSNNTGSTVHLFNNGLSGNAVFDEASDTNPLNGTLESQDLYITNTSSYNAGGNLQADPLFLDAANEDFHLQASSPAIDSGDNNAPSMPSDDIDGDTRPVDGDTDGTATVDMGVDEYFNPAVVLTSPNGGEVIASGGTQSITWTALSGSVSFDLEYSINAGGTWRTIATGLSGTSYAWSLPAVAGNKRKCMVRITAYDSGSNQTGQDTSDGTFMIEVIKITSPAGGESYSSGDTVQIRWNTNATKSPVDKVVIKYHKVGVTGWSLITVLRGGNPGSYDWVIPAGFGTGQYRIKVNLWDANKRRRGADKTDGLISVL